MATGDTGAFALSSVADGTERDVRAVDGTVLKVQLETAAGEVKTLSFNNPKTDLTLTVVRQGFSSLLTNNWLMNNAGSAYFSSVSEASYVTTTSLPEE